MRRLTTLVMVLVLLGGVGGCGGSAATQPHPVFKPNSAGKAEVAQEESAERERAYKLCMENSPMFAGAFAPNDRLCKWKAGKYMTERTESEARVYYGCKAEGRSQGECFRAVEETRKHLPEKYEAVGSRE